MKNRIDSMIQEWAEDVVNSCHKSGYYGVNVVEKILSDPGISTKHIGHRILWWPKTHRIATISRAVHCIDPVSQICLIIEYGKPIMDDGNIFTKKDLSKTSSITIKKFNELVKSARKRLREITKI